MARSGGAYRTIRPPVKNVHAEIDLPQVLPAKVSLHVDRQFRARLAPMINFGIWQGRLNPVAQSYHQRQAGLPSAAKFNARERVSGLAGPGRSCISEVMLALRSNSEATNHKS